MHTKFISMLLSVVMISSVFYATASAESNRSNLEERNSRSNSTSSIEKEMEKPDTISTEERDREDQTATSTDEEATSENHRSAVATFVKSLLSVADRGGGIGEKVREVARDQDESASTTTAAMKEVEHRSSFKTFLIGSDYKNLGVIRSQLATTSNNIAKLKSLLDKATTDADRAELNAQIKVLEAEQNKIDTFVKTNQSKFSLFGWFTKLFVK